MGSIVADLLGRDLTGCNKMICRMRQHVSARLNGNQNVSEANCMVI